ncbi:uncharacterized protein LOC120313282 isoform X1 [Crotalus tigris]|uniref:uncharacterized protein LOC120313282 isoform X1 n=1 Tax=Crotalus tigris TaxID=88082 RepID=UPI00192F589C|nr:uncharacterized protein LOC120313282 isoform X1 [Crotalus tigris]
MSGTESLPYLTPASSCRAQPDPSKEEGKKGNLEPLRSRRNFSSSRCSSPPSDCHTSKTVRRILALCLISLFTLLGNAALDLSQILESWRHAEKAASNFSSCRSFLAFSVFHLLVREANCQGGEGGGDGGDGGGGDGGDGGGERGERGGGGKMAVENLSWPEDLLKSLVALCSQYGEGDPGTISWCKDNDNFSCPTYIPLVRERVNGTEGAGVAFLQLKMISRILEILLKPEEGDHRKVRSNPDWLEVVFLRLLLRIKGAVLRAQEMSVYPEEVQALWHQLSALLTSSVFISESAQDCWAEHPNVSILATYPEGLHMVAPSLGFRSLSRPFMDELDVLQRCLLQKSQEKLQKKSKDIISLISLKIILLLITSLIYPAVLFSFKEMTEWIQNYARILKERTEDLKQERHVVEDLLHQMLPKSVAKQLRKHKHVEAENYDQVTIFFSDIVGFTTIAASCTPLQVVEMLNNLYICFDTRIDSYDVYKVETIGDAYMVVSGLPERNGTRHAHEIAKMALDLVAAVRQVAIPHLPTSKLELRAGIHTGACVAGIVGHKMPRYCLFGDTVNTASRMESTSLPQKIHISSATYQALLEDDTYDIQPRGEIEVKGKGKMKTYWLLGNKNYSVQNDSLVCHWNPGMSQRKKAGQSAASGQELSTGTERSLDNEQLTIASQTLRHPAVRAGVQPGSPAGRERDFPGPLESLKTLPLHPANPSQFHPGCEKPSLPGQFLTSSSCWLEDSRSRSPPI